MFSAAGNEDAGHRRRNVMVARAGRSSTYQMNRTALEEGEDNASAATSYDKNAHTIALHAFWILDYVTRLPRRLRPVMAMSGHPARVYCTSGSDP